MRKKLGISFIKDLNHFSSLLHPNLMIPMHQITIAFLSRNNRDAPFRR